MFFIKDLKQAISSKTVNHFLITSGGTAINGLLGMLFYIVLARSLGPSVYGAFAVAVATIALLADVADLGIDTGIIRFVGKHANSSQALKYIKLGLEVKFIVWLSLLILGWVFAPVITQFVFTKPEFSNPFRFALIGVGGALFFSLTTHAIQAYQKYWVWSLINISMNSLRLLAIITLIVFSISNFELTLMTYIATPFIGFFITLFLLPNFLAVREEKIIAKELFNYSKWVALIGFLTATGSRLDTFISARLLSITEVGIYSAALQLSVVVPQLVFALATVVAPKLSSLDSNKKAISYLKKLQLLVGGLFLGGFLLIPIIVLIVPVIYGQAYKESINPFIILFVAQLIFLLSLPAHQAIFYYFSKPKIFTWMALGQLLITGVLGWQLILNFGVVGAALAILVSNIFNFIVPGVWVIYQFKKGGRSEKEKHLGAYVG